MSANDAEAVIGQDDPVVRVLNFSSGGYDAAMQLGVVHALLVIQGRAPDAIVGISAGAVNAVAAAEILQAGEAEEKELIKEEEARRFRPHLVAKPQATVEEQLKAKLDSRAKLTHDSRWQDLPARTRCEIQRRRMETRTARFREVLRAYERAPYEISSAIIPDAYQIDADQPLVPQELPIHATEERQLRQQATGSKHGLVRLYNQLLQVRLSVGAYTKITRRVLGLVAARGVPDARARRLAVGMEAARMWWLLRANLFRVAHLGPVIHDATERRESRRKGAPADTLISKSRFWSGIKRILEYVISLTVLGFIWVGLTGSIVFFPFVMVGAVLGWVMLFAEMKAQFTGLTDSVSLWVFADRLSEHWLIVAVLVYAVVAALVVLAVVMSAGIRNSWSRFVEFNLSSTWGITKELVLGYAGVVVLFIWSLFAGLLLVAGIQAVAALAAFSSLAVESIFGSAPMPSTEVLESNGLVAALKGAWPILWRIVVVGFSVLTIVVVGLRRRITKRVRGLRTSWPKFLESYDLSSSLLGPHAMRQFFVRLFDPEYYGKRPIDEIVDDAMPGGRDPDEDDKDRPQTRIKDVKAYADESHIAPIRVGLAVADVRDGKLDVVPESTPVVDGLLAATAVAPLFPAQKIGERWFLDGAAISAASIHPALNLLREHDVASRGKYVELFSVNSLPFSKPHLQASASTSEADNLGLPLNLVDTIVRANALKRYRDATLERTLTELYWRALPRQGAQPIDGKEYLRVCVTPIEPEMPLGLNAQVLAAETRADRHRLIREAVADGCRAALEVMIGASQNHAFRRDRTPCSAAVHRHLSSRMSNGDGGLSGLTDIDCAVTLDANQACGPGLSEVCEDCAIRLAAHPTKRKNEKRVLNFTNSDGDRTVPWPHEREFTPDRGAREPTLGGRRTQSSGEDNFACVLGWPADRKRNSDERKRPLVSLLFSGGVFRGVFQLGVLNAVSEVGLKPHLVAGASIGSITAAMAAETITAGGTTDTDALASRRRKIARMASAYLTIDRIVLTDRFADLVRTATVRAGSTRFSLHQSDRFFRRYDTAGSAQFAKNARAVVAGIERLFYVSPFELLDLVRAFRESRPDTVFRFLKDHVQEWLDRMGVGVEVLGAEPLELLIQRYVTDEIRTRKGWSQEGRVPFDAYRSDGICLMATATDLTTGSLVILGKDQLRVPPDPAPPDYRAHPQPSLSEGLLASSAFPGVFRPRASSELEPQNADRHHYIDGGVMDNLPLHAVTEFLCQAAQDGHISRRPETHGVAVPHLVLATSLKVDPPTGDDISQEDLKELSENWPALWKRARQLNYNRKLQDYSDTQSNLRDILDTRGEAGWTPLDLELVTIRPKWLCGTYAFHPMLGFRRAKQAASIAHGCKSTLLELARLRDRLEKSDRNNAKDGREPFALPWTDRWGIDEDALEGMSESANGSEASGSRSCWYRTNKDCPFSSDCLKELKPKLPPRTIGQLSLIHSECKVAPNHERNRGASNASPA